ncbi:MAG: N-6 DNA methylase, partial [Lacipirellulaceae bacterium]
MGAYYTPIPIVNMMLSELEEHHPLTKGMRVLDPSCGSGAFLVQCFRRLIEREFPPGTKPSPTELRSLLENHIFGVDVEEDACNVTELSLALTLLDYIDPPDLEDQRHRFKLPALRDKNIYCSNFFSKESAWDEEFTKRKFDWIVGNPPWKRLKPSQLREDEQPVWNWIEEHKKTHPVGGNQAARAFAWKATDYLSEDGEIALFMPAMTLFENAAEEFRRTFFQTFHVYTVANLSNLAEVLAGGRFRVPAACFFYRHRSSDEQSTPANEYVRTYSPLVANQEATRPEKPGRRNETWSIVINASEIRDIPYSEIAGGSGLPWKLATWGSNLDHRLLSRLSRRFPNLADLEDNATLVVAEGSPLVESPVAEGASRTRPEPRVRSKNVLNVKALEKLRHVFAFPDSALAKNRKNYTTLRGGRRGIEVSRPPHVIVSAARLFAVYSDEYLIVPPRQIGIVSPVDDERLLKCLSLFLSSDFMLYHQFFSSSQFGVKRDVATLRSLRGIPIPLLELSKVKVNEWLRLHKELVKTSPRRIGRPANHVVQKSLDGKTPEPLTPLVDELNDLVSDALGLTNGERALVEDFVHVRLKLNDGKVGDDATRTPTTKEIRKYASRLKRELDDFVGGDLPKRHAIGVVYDELS